jgi:Tol biopolymer transport system component
VPPAAERLSAALADRYRVARELGAGGMATVYLAKDLKHDRKVAIKVLKPELAAVLGAERFVVEIKTTAALSHPHILPLFDSGTADGFLFYVMPYIQGETIREKLNRETQFGVDEAVRIAREVADALDYAHRHGVIHRDIKPENILLHDGRPMVMDFGIALAVSAAAGGRMTETGLSLGTPHYMSPEQATAEKEISGRSDVYSLASVLYEMLAGQPPHIGGSAQQIIMKIIAEPVQPVTALRKAVPPNVTAALAKALEKLPADRFDSARAFADALGDAAFAVRSATAPKSTPAALRIWIRDARSRVAVAMIAALVVVVIIASGRERAPGASERHPAPMLFPLAFAPGGGIAGAPDDRGNAYRPSRTAFAISPGGGTIVYVGERNGVRQLFLRPLVSELSTPISGTEGAESPFFSPDGQSIGYWSDGRLMRTPLSGGQPTQIATVTRITGASWSDTERIAVGVTGVGIILYSATGAGQVDTIAEPGARFPHFLPGGESIVFTQLQSGLAERFDVNLITTDRTRKRLVDDAADGRYVPTGHLVFARTGKLVAVSFDAKRLEVTGTPVVILPEIMQALNGTTADAITGAMQAAISASGHLVYLAGGVTPDRIRQLMWIDRQGRQTPVAVAGTGAFFAASLSPDGTKAAVSSLGRQDLLKVVDFTRGTIESLTDPGEQLWPVWTLDGQRIVRRGLVGDTNALVWGPPDGSRPATSIVEGKAVAGLYPAFWSPDGKQLFGVRFLETGLHAISMSDGTVTLVDNVPKDIVHPTLSPNGKWLAYTAREAGSPLLHVFVQSWPSLDRKVKVSTEGGGHTPKWTRNGAELIYLQTLSPDTAGVFPIRVWSVQFGTGSELSAGPPSALFTSSFLGRGSHIRSYDVTQDGSRFLVVTGHPVRAPMGEARVMVNWFTELRSLSSQRETRP